MVGVMEETDFDIHWIMIDASTIIDDKATPHVDVREPGCASTHPLPHTYSEDSVRLARDDFLDFLPTPQPSGAASFSISVQANRGGHESQPESGNAAIPA